MLSKEDILALAWEHSEGSRKRYTFTEENLFAFLKELKKESAPVQDEREAFEAWADQQWPGAKRQQLERDEYGQYKNTIYRDFWTGWQARATRPAQTEQQPIRLPQRADTSHGDAFDTQLAEAYNAALDEVARLNAAPIAQSAPAHDCNSVAPEDVPAYVWGE